jgi:hypothetical protein
MNNQQTPQISNLTEEQKHKLLVYQQNWQRRILSTEPIDKERALDTIVRAYSYCGYEQPEVIFCSSPRAAENMLFNQLQTSLKSGFKSALLHSFWVGEFQQGLITDELAEEINRLHEEDVAADRIYNNGVVRGTLGSLRNFIRKEIWWNQTIKRVEDIWNKYGIRPTGDEICIHPQALALEGGSAGSLEFCLVELDLSDGKSDEKEGLEILKLLVENCGFIYPFGALCIVCDHPVHLALDSSGRLHSEAEAAVKFSDGFEIYAYHGTKLPEEYGKVHPSLWKVQWLLDECDVGVKIALRNGIGYSRICQELKTNVLDSNQTNTLLEIDADLEFEPVHLLKVSCSNTGEVRFFKVANYIKSVKNARRWVKENVGSLE